MAIIEIANSYTECKEYDPDVLKHLHQVLTEMLKDFIEICEENDIQYFLHDGTIIGAVRHEGFIPWDDEIDVALLREDYERLIRILDKENEKYYLSNWKKRFDIDDASYTQKTLFCLKNTKLKQTEHDCGLYDYGIYIDINAIDEIPENKIKKLLFIKIMDLVYFLMSITNSIECDSYTSKKNENIGHRIKFLFNIINVPRISAKIFTRLIKRYQGKSEMVCSISEQGFIEKSYPKSCFNSSLKVKFEDTCANIPIGYDELLTLFYGDYMEIPPISERYNHHWKMIDFGDY